MSYMKTKNIEEGREKDRVSLAVICFMLLFAGMGVVSATGYYVKVDGNDSLNGTSLEEAWQHPSYAAQQAQAGDTIYLIDSRANTTVTEEQITGTLTFTNNSTIVTGVGTNFTSELVPGNWIKSDNSTYGGEWYEVASIINNTYLELSTHFANTTHSSSAKKNLVWIDEHVSFGNSGNATHPIVMKAYNGTPTLDGVDKTGSGIEINSVSYINITGSLIIKNYRRGIYIDSGSSHINIVGLMITSHDASGIYIRPNCSYISVDKAKITHTGGSGIISHCFLEEFINHHITITNSMMDDNNHDAINILCSNRNVLIENNSISHATNGAGIMIHNWGNENITIKNNTIEDSTRGIQLIGVDGCLVEGNTILNSYASNGLLILVYEGTEDTVREVTIQNNIIQNSSSSDIVFRITDEMAAQGKKIENITLINNSITEDCEFRGPNIANITVRNIPDVTRTITVTDNAVSNLQVEFTDGKVFSADSPDTPHWYPEKSNLSITGTGTVTLTMYNMTAVPASDLANVTVNKFDTSLPQGEILVNFTVNTIDGNNVVFSVWSLKPSHYYLIKRDGIDFATKQANSSGYIQFNNSEWSPRTFTIEESLTATGNISGIVTDTIDTPIEGATVTADGYSNTTNNTGGYIITIPIGNYTVTASKTGYYPNSTTAQVLENQTTTVDFILTRHKRKLPVAKPVCATGIAILIIVAYWRYRRRRRRMRSGGLIVLVLGITVDWSSFIYM